MRNKKHLYDVRIPEAASKRFEKQFRHLINQLAGSEGFKGEYLRKEVFSKYLDESLVPAQKRSGDAVSKWLSVDQTNSRTNQRIYLLDEEKDLGWVTLDRLTTNIRRLVSRILGPLVYPSVLQTAGHTNGASTRVRRSPASRVLKHSGEVHISSSAVKHWLAAFSTTRMSLLPLTVCESSVLFTVPKKSEIDRCACKEPEGNLLLQRSVGNHIRYRLRKWGIDLNDQSRNRDLARRGVKEGLATIDLSSASDTLSKQLVQHLLPFEWYWLLDDLRVKQVVIPSDLHPSGTEVTHETEMFSSMGNGFTFELESLLFFCITRVVTDLSGFRKSPVSVYGDDIIAPCAVANRLFNVLRLFGFIPNVKKTHAKGPFRESCGGHYWNGFDVTPFYLRGEVLQLPDLIKTLNRLLEWDGRGWGMFVTECAARFWQRWILLVPPELWGGIDPQDPTALVTGHTPRKRLVPVTERQWRKWTEGTLELKGIDNARLLTWLHEREHCDEPFAVDPSSEVGFRLAKVKSLGERTSWRPLMAFEELEIAQSE